MADKINQDQLFLKYLNGELGQEEIQYLEDHYSPEEQKKIIDRILKSHWNNKYNLDHPEKYRVMLDKIHKRIEQAPIIRRHVYFDFLYYSKMAASVLIFLSVIIYFAVTYQPEITESPVVTMVHKSAAFGQKLNITLPDGSSVVLNSGTSITYPEIFSEDIRPVEIDGEAYFEVRKDSRPFVAKGKQMEVQVLGTAFNINTNLSTVALTEGKVLITNGVTHATLSPGQMGILTGEDEMFDIMEFDYDQHIAWKDGVINIEGYTVDEVLKILEKWYGVAINVRNVDLQREFSGKLSHRSLDNVLQGLCYVLNCNYKIKMKNVEIY
jgi:transmembrane sensor